LVAFGIISHGCWFGSVTHGCCCVTGRLVTRYAVYVYYGLVDYGLAVTFAHVAVWLLRWVLPLYGPRCGLHFDSFATWFLGCYVHLFRTFRRSGCSFLVTALYTHTVVACGWFGTGLYFTYTRAPVTHTVVTPNVGWLPGCTHTVGSVPVVTLVGWLQLRLVTQVFWFSLQLDFTRGWFTFWLLHTRLHTWVRSRRFLLLPIYVVTRCCVYTARARYVWLFRLPRLVLHRLLRYVYGSFHVLHVAVYLGLRSPVGCTVGSVLRSHSGWFTCPFTFDTRLVVLLHVSLVVAVVGLRWILFVVGYDVYWLVTGCLLHVVYVAVLDAVTVTFGWIWLRCSSFTVVLHGCCVDLRLVLCVRLLVGCIYVYVVPQVTLDLRYVWFTFSLVTQYTRTVGFVGSPLLTYHLPFTLPTGYVGWFTRLIWLVIYVYWYCGSSLHTTHLRITFVVRWLRLFVVGHVQRLVALLFVGWYVYYGWLFLYTVTTHGWLVFLRLRFGCRFGYYTRVVRYVGLQFTRCSDWTGFTLVDFPHGCWDVRWLTVGYLVTHVGYPFTVVTFTLRLWLLVVTVCHVPVYTHCTHTPLVWFILRLRFTHVVHALLGSYVALHTLGLRLRCWFAGYLPRTFAYVFFFFTFAGCLHVVVAFGWFGCYIAVVGLGLRLGWLHTTHTFVYTPLLQFGYVTPHTFTRVWTILPGWTVV